VKGSSTGLAIPPFWFVFLFPARLQSRFFLISRRTVIGSAVVARMFFLSSFFDLAVVVIFLPRPPIPIFKMLGGASLGFSTFLEAFFMIQKGVGGSGRSKSRSFLFFSMSSPPRSFLTFEDPRSPCFPPEGPLIQSFTLSPFWMRPTKLLALHPGCASFFSFFSKQSGPWITFCQVQGVLFAAFLFLQFPPFGPADVWLMGCSPPFLPPRSSLQRAADPQCHCFPQAAG